jgi:glucokinase
VVRGAGAHLHPFRTGVPPLQSAAMRILAGDIGGTKTILRFVDASGEAIERRYESGAYATFEQLVGEFLALVDASPSSGGIDATCFAIAGPVIGGRADVTNLRWVLDAESLARRFPIGRVSLINDFQAVALGVPLLGANGLLSLHAGVRKTTEPIAILGAGTGLGEAIVTFAGNLWTVIPSEGGHADFAPQDERQARLYLALHERFGHVSWERVLSGHGLVNIFTFLGGDEVDPARIPELAAGGDARAIDALAIFVDVYGAEAGNMALRVLARGGVFLAGGIAAKNQRLFTDGRFLDAFLRKGRFHDLLAEVPVDLILEERVGLMGAAELARRRAGGVESNPAAPR